MTQTTDALHTTATPAGSATGATPGLTYRQTIIAILLYSLLALALIPVAARPGPDIPGITAVFGGVIFATELSTGFLLFLLFRETPAWSLLVLGCAYLFSALMVVPHVLTFPDALVSGRAVIDLSRQSPGWLFVLWIGGYALLTLASTVLEMRAAEPRFDRRQAARAMALAAGAVLAVVAGLALISTVWVDHLPPLIGGSSWTTLNRLITIVALLMLAGGIAISLWKIRRPLFLWLSLALTAMAFANILSEVGGARYSLGWSAGRVSWLISACMLFLYFLNQFAQQRRLLRTSEQQFQALVQGIKDYAIFTLDLDGRVSSWNSGAETIKGYHPEEIIGQHFSRFYTPADQEAGLPARSLHIAGASGKYEAEGWRVRKDGTRFWASVVIDAIHDETGSLIGFAKVTRDITERRQAQEMLEQARERLFQSQKMEAVGQLTGGVAHDFNNLLTIIMGNLDTAKRHTGKLSGGVADQLTRALGNARTGAERAAVLTQRLLAFSRRQPLAPRALDLNKFVATAVDFLRRSLGEAVQIEVVGSAGLWQAEADPHQLEASLLNLAVNARDAMPEGGKLTIETSNAFLDEDYCRNNPEVARGQYVLLAVTDTGLGMSREVAERAFEPFFTTKGVGQGTGLGLSQVYGFVKQSGGHVKIYSEPGQGTTLKIYLPRLVGETRPSEAEPSRKAGKSLGESILVVEDDADVRSYIVEVLRELDYEVLEAPDAAAAFHLVEQRGGRIDLLLSDVILPGANGRELVRQLHQRWPGLKVLYMTGYSRNAIVHQGRLDPAVEVIQKPLVQADLAERIRSVLDGPHRPKQ
jgi:PAS domain S-box-containing protein